jgi:hypothetical protein
MKILSLIFIFLISCFNAFSMHKCDIKGLDKKEVLKALFASAKPLGLGFMHYVKDQELTNDEIEKIINHKYEPCWVDYLHGRLMKVDFSGDILDTWAYNRDNGENAAENAIEMLRKKQ